MKLQATINKLVKALYTITICDLFRITCEMSIWENLLGNFLSSTAAPTLIAAKHDRKSIAHCKMFWIMPAMDCVSLDKKHLQVYH